MAAMALLCACHKAQEHRGQVLEARLSATAAKRIERSSGASLSLPEVRVYDGRHRLILRQFGFKQGSFASDMSSAISADRPVVGPSYSATVAELEAPDGQPAVLAANDQSTSIFDYWAAWCIPCRKLEPELRAWAAAQPAGSVRIVRVDADLSKLERARGGRVFLLKKGPDGKFRKVELR